MKAYYGEKATKRKAEAGRDGNDASLSIPLKAQGEVPAGGSGDKASSQGKNGSHSVCSL